MEDGLQDAKEFSPLTLPELNILLSLAMEEKHGYQIMLEVEERTGGKVQLGAGTLYGALKRMVGRGLIEEVKKEQSEAGAETSRRRYYRITEFGVRVLAADISRMKGIIGVADRIPRLGELLPQPEGS